MYTTNPYKMTIPPAPHVEAALRLVGDFYTMQESLRPEQPLVLDAGCGEGRHACYLASLGFRVIGIDTDSDLIREATRRTPQTYLDDGIVRYDQEDVSALRVGKQRAFDGVLCNETLHLLPSSKRQTVMQKLMSITASGGFHVVSAYVGPAGSGALISPLAPGALRTPYDQAGWDVIQYAEDPYNETQFSGGVVVNSIASVVAIKP